MIMLKSTHEKILDAVIGDQQVFNSDKENAWNKVISEMDTVHVRNVESINVSHNAERVLLNELVEEKELSIVSLSDANEQLEGAYNNSLERIKDLNEDLDFKGLDNSILKQIIHTLGNHCELKKNSNLPKKLGPELHKIMNEILLDDECKWDFESLPVVVKEALEENETGTPVEGNSGDGDVETGTSTHEVQ